MEIRPEIKLMAVAMEMKMREGDEKRGNTAEDRDWRYMGSAWMFRRLLGEVGELADALNEIEDDDNGDWGVLAPLREAADVANLAWMNVDRLARDYNLTGLDDLDFWQNEVTCGPGSHASNIG